MLKLLKVILVVIITATTTGCAITTSVTTNQHTSVADIISPTKYKVVKQVTGSSQSCYVFGIGGLENKNDISQAYHNMVNNASLQPNQAIIHSNIERSTRFLILWTVNRYIATGTVIEFIGTDNQTTNNETSDKTTHTPTISKEHLGDELVAMTLQYVKENNIDLIKDNRYIYDINAGYYITKDYFADKYGKSTLLKLSDSNN